jgi:hypothetical protein
VTGRSRWRSTVREGAASSADSCSVSTRSRAGTAARSGTPCDVLPREIRIDHHDTAVPGSGANYVAGSFIHQYQGPPPPWPDRAIAGPPWWIDLLYDLADTLDR